MTHRSYLSVFGAGAVLLLASSAHADVLQEHTIRKIREEQLASEVLKTAMLEQEKAQKAFEEAAAPLVKQLGEANPKECRGNLVVPKSRDVCLSELEKLKKAAAAEVVDKHVDETVPADGLKPFCGTAPITKDDCAKHVKKFVDNLVTLTAAEENVLEKESAVTAASRALGSAKLETATAISREVTATRPSRSRNLKQRLQAARVVRCYTALCWGGDDGTRYGIEPLLDVPVSMFWALGNGGLAKHINSNQIQVTVTAGIRYWFAYDVMSVGLILAQPNLTNGAPIQTEYSEQAFTKESISRPFPTLALGFWGDVFMVTGSYDQLRNTDGSAAVDSRYLYEEVLARTFTLGVSLNIVTGMRNAVSATVFADGGEK